MIESIPFKIEGGLPRAALTSTSTAVSLNVTVHGARDREVAVLIAAVGSRRLILGIDPLDPTSNIPARLLAYERLLELAPAWRGDIVLVQTSVPATEVPEELRLNIEDLVRRINARFGEADWVPIRHLSRSCDHGVIARLYRRADVALVTPLHDGLARVAKAFVDAQDRARPGVLVARLVAETQEQVTGLALDLDEALRMGEEERRRRHALLASSLADGLPQRWAAVFLERLLRADRTVA